MDKVNSSMFKYLIYDSSARKEFINQLDMLKDKVSSQKFRIYDDETSNNFYNQSMLNYIQSVIDLNKNYKKSEKILNSYMND